MILPEPCVDTEEYWRAAQASRLLLRYCASCGEWLHPRRTLCAAGHALAWRAATGTGTLVAHSVVRHALGPALRAQVPYTLTLTRVAEGPQLLTSIPGEHAGLVCGAAMQVMYDPVSPRVTLPRFVPASPS